jgi:hypothetical protein
VAHDIITLKDHYAATLRMAARHVEESRVIGIYHLQHWRDGELIHEELFENLWTTAGKNLCLDTILAGSAFTATVVIGLKGIGSAAAADTQSSHAGWSEVGLANAPTYSGSRKTPSWSSASSGSKATSANVSFSITSSGTVAGAFVNLNGSSTVDNTTGTLFSAGDFGASRSVVNGDTLTVGYTATLS